MSPSAARLAARLTRGYQTPRLTPAEAYDLDAEEQYRAWDASSGAETFRRLDAAGQTVQDSDEISQRAWWAIISQSVGTRERRAAYLETTPLIADNADALSVVWESLDLPFSLPPQRTWDEPIPHFARFRALARLLALDAHRRLSHDDRDGALEMALVGVRFGLQIARGSSLIGRLVACAVQAMSRRALWAALPHANPAALAAALSDLQTALASTVPFADTLAEEKRFMLRLLLHGWTALPGASAPAPDPNLSTHLATLLHGKQRFFRRCAAYLDAWQELAPGPYRSSLWRPPAPRFFVKSSRQAIENTYFADTVQIAQNRLALVAIALHLHRAAYHQWPASLTDLVPAYLPHIPDDPFAFEGPLAYHPDGTGYLLYSIGPDEKDENGTAITTPLTEDARGDIVAGVNL